uniref:TOG domain-containing protein n=1 Tax=Photinus pyralis TaxID=7054 RepID=A0A1Y1K5P3_PHOPY
MATEDEEWKKLSTEDRCVHKQWKARVSGYEDAAKLFKQIDDEKSPEFSRYLGLIKKFVSDSNAVGQEKGLEAALAYVENYAHAGKTVNDVMSGIVTKCIAAPKTKTRELAMQITLMYVEIEKYEAVQEELIKGMDQKNPKIVAACITAVTAALKEFGSKIVNPKPLIKKIQTLFADRDKSVRDEARLMVVEMFKWIGPALRSQLNNLQPVQVTELEAEFAKVEGQKVTPTRYIRSQQEKQAKLAAETEEAEGDEDVEEEGYSTPTLDPYDIADPVDILSKLPKNFYEQLEAKKWQERKEALELLEKLIKTPKLENGDYGDLIRALKKIIQKDTNVVVIALAAKNLACLANGLKKRFQQYAAFCVPTLLEKFKEKKQNVVLAIREAIDAVYDSITVEVILEDVVEALNSKNPSVKAETASFLSRAFAKTSPTSLNKKLLKTYSAALIKNINEPGRFHFFYYSLLLFHF